MSAGPATAVPAADEHQPVAAALRLLRLADPTTACAVRTAAELDIVAALVERPRPCAELAADLGLNGAALLRLVRLLCDLDLLAGEPACGVLTVADAGRLLHPDHPLSLRAAHLPSAVDLATWAAFPHSLRTGGPSFDVVAGCDHQAYCDSRPDEARRWDEAYRSAARLELLTAVRARTWSADRTVVDLGGGSGTFLAGILARHPAMRGLLLDLPQVVASAPAVLAAAGVAERCEVVGGSFFDELPRGADTYLLKSVLGAWSDTDAIRLLRGVRSAMRPDSLLVVFEPVLAYGDAFGMGSVVQLQTLALYGGPDRTKEDYDRLVAAAGLRVRRIVARPTLPLIEIEPVPQDASPPAT